MQRPGYFAFGILLACGDATSDGTGTGANGEGGDPTGGTTTSSSVTTGGTTTSTTASSTSATTSSSGGGGGGGGSCDIEVVPGGTMPDPGMPGVPQLLATDASQIWGVAIDPTHVFWTSGSNPGRLVRVPKDGGEVEALTSSLVDPYAPFVNDGYVYIGDVDGAIKRVSTSGGCVEVIVSGQDLPVGLAFDGTSLYFADFTTGDIGKTPKAGGSVELLATGQNNPTDMIVLGGYLYWLNRAGNVVDEGYLARVSVTGGMVETLVTGLTVPTEIAVFQDKVLFSGTDIANDTDIWMTYDPVTSMASVLTADSGHTSQVVVDGDTLIWGHVVPNLIQRFAPGQGPTDLVSLPERPFYLDLDTTHVFWSQIDVGEVLRLSNP